MPDDSDVFSYEKWNGLKNRQVFIAESEGSSDEPTIDDNLNINSVSISEELNHHLSDTSSQILENRDYAAEVTDIVDENGNPDFTSTPMGDHSYAKFTSTPMSDHSYVQLVLEDEKEEMGNADDSNEKDSLKTERKVFHKYVETAENSSSLTGTIVFNNLETIAVKLEKKIEVNPDYQKHPYCKLGSPESHSEKQKEPVRVKKTHQSESPKIIASNFQPFPEIKLMNERKSSRKKGFLLPNGMICNLIKIKCSQFSWNFDLKESDNEKKKFNEMKVFVKNTCGFDCLVHIIQFGALDNPVYNSYIKNSENGTLHFIINFMKTGVNTQIFFERLKILNKLYPIKKDTQLTCLSPFEVDAFDSILRIWIHFLNDEPSGLKTYQCSKVNCIGKASEKIVFLSINWRPIWNDGYQQLQNAVIYDAQCLGRKCQQPGCTGLITEKRELNIHVCIELDVRKRSDTEKTMECCLNYIPINLNLGSKYR